MPIQNEYRYIVIHGKVNFDPRRETPYAISRFMICVTRRDEKASHGFALIFSDFHCFL